MSFSLRHPMKRKMLSGFGHYKLFQAVKLHFSPTAKFDIMSYSGKVNTSRETYDKKKGHRNLYERMALNYDSWQLYRMYVGAAANNKLGSYPGNVLNEGGELFLNEVESVLSNPLYHFEISAEVAARFCIEHDCGIRDYLNMEPHSPLIVDMISGTTNPMIIVIWDKLFDISSRIDVDDLAIGHVKLTLDNLRSLVDVDKMYYSKAIKEIWKSNDLIKSNQR